MKLSCINILAYSGALFHHNSLMNLVGRGGGGGGKGGWSALPDPPLLCTKMQISVINESL